MQSVHSSEASDPVLYELFERCNRTELYQLARRAGHSPPPGADKDTLIRIIIGELSVPENAVHVVDEWRHALMAFIIDHRKVLESQLTCPAKSMNPKACFSCVDAQVISCLVENKKHLRLIELHKKR